MKSALLETPILEIPLLRSNGSYLQPKQPDENSELLESIFERIGLDTSQSMTSRPERRVKSEGVTPLPALVKSTSQHQLLLRCWERSSSFSSSVSSSLDLGAEETARSTEPVQETSEESESKKKRKVPLDEDVQLSASSHTKQQRLT